MLAKIAAMPEPDRAMAERLHAIVKASAPALSPRTWYGMPAYAKDGKVVCFFQSAQKFKTRYATLGFSDKANLDEGAMWPTAFALNELTAADEARDRGAREEERQVEGSARVFANVPRDCGADHRPGRRGGFSSWDRPVSQRDQLAAFGVIAKLPEVQRDARFVADHFGVVAGMERVDISRADLAAAAVVGVDLHPAGNDVAEV